MCTKIVILENDVASLCPGALNTKDLIWDGFFYINSVSINEIRNFFVCILRAVVINCGLLSTTDICFLYYSLRCGRKSCAIFFLKLLFRPTNTHCTNKMQEGITFPRINLLKTKRNLLYIRNQPVPRSKHFPPRL